MLLYQTYGVIVIPSKDNEKLQEVAELIIKTLNNTIIVFAHPQRYMSYLDVAPTEQFQLKLYKEGVQNLYSLRRSIVQLLHRRWVNPLLAEEDSNADMTQIADLFMPYSKPDQLIVNNDIIKSFQFDGVTLTSTNDRYVIDYWDISEKESYLEESIREYKVESGYYVTFKNHTLKIDALIEHVYNFV